MLISFLYILTINEFIMRWDSDGIVWWGNELLWSLRWNMCEDSKDDRSEIILWKSDMIYRISNLSLESYEWQ